MALAGSIAGGIAGLIGNPAELMMVRMQADKAKPPESESGGALTSGERG
jgi:dicarboxylate transporter 10